VSAAIARSRVRRSHGGSVNAITPDVVQVRVAQGKGINMLEYQDKVVQDVAACTCDRCQRRMTPDDYEWQEELSVSCPAHTSGQLLL